ncbi:MAG TPA: 30S ribosomal protein S3 [Clostridiales bacterium]|nr:MAG: 30S ribosomal protein S3 [Clostridiales bacterium GWD2_32_19]HCC07385.1 30S ribosomal protein S3 [Clostridiales bacterium]
MGQKVNPHGLRVGINKGWSSTWYAEKDFADLLLEDNKIRKFVKSNYYQAGIADIQIERTSKRAKVIIKTSRPGILIGKKGSGVDKIQSDIQKLSENKVLVDVLEIKKPEKNAQLVAEKIASELENRVSFRKAMKQAMQRALKSGIKGIKTSVSGRLGGAEMARTEHYHEGTIPLQTLRADIDYGFAEAHTTFGKTGVKVWIYNGEILPVKKKDTEGVAE